MRHYIAVAIAISLFGVPWLATQFPEQADFILASFKNAESQLASVIIAHNAKTISQLQTKYSVQADDTKKIHILIVPGHEPHQGGAEFGSLKERDMAVTLADDLADFLRGNPKYDVTLTRDADSWNPVFATYFDTQWNSIIEWEKAYKDQSVQELESATSAKPAVFHNDAPQDVAYRLFGITKWANENDIDLTIHVHFNDYPGRKSSSGKYSGFSIYTPESIYANGTTTHALSEAVFNHLKKYTAISNFPGENTGVVNERELIAIGSHNTADSASMLVEYGYIYQPEFVQPSIRPIALKDLAYDTYLGIEDFLDGNGSSDSTRDTIILPYTWTTPMTESDQGKVDVFALQTALSKEGLYPPVGKTKNDCPRTGTMGMCTLSALASFQKKYGITGENRVAGPKTIAELNALYSSQTP